MSLMSPKWEEIFTSLLLILPLWLLAFATAFVFELSDFGLTMTWILYRSVYSATQSIEQARIVKVQIIALTLTSATLFIFLDFLEFQMRTPYSAWNEATTDLSLGHIKLKITGVWLVAAWGRMMPFKQYLDGYCAVYSRTARDDCPNWPIAGYAFMTFVVHIAHSVYMMKMGPERMSPTLIIDKQVSKGIAKVAAVLALMIIVLYSSSSGFLSRLLISHVLLTIAGFLYLLLIHLLDTIRTPVVYLLARFAHAFYEIPNFIFNYMNLQFVIKGLIAGLILNTIYSEFVRPFFMAGRVIVIDRSHKGPNLTELVVTVQCAFLVFHLLILYMNEVVCSRHNAVEAKQDELPSFIMTQPLDSKIALRMCAMVAPILGMVNGIGKIEELILES
ncbi:hypothetical protein PMAYCL1PPCAC_20294 [Pristionchus mayeri]|uniref:Uncharacterized protein n=1 Tax=Pristionchus mayeri TaxID=1317129 RepID=A0AAN5I3A5_9BILA|nr:hypothetical protein PMAYCL1PPCAC_20294 [Pristionchus mayeri]